MLDRWSTPTRKRRLSITETLMLDPRRKVVIVRVDDAEHVLLLGAEREQVLDRAPAKEEPVFEPVAPDTVDTDAETPGASVTRLGQSQ